MLWNLKQGFFVIIVKERDLDLPFKNKNKIYDPLDAVKDNHNERPIWRPRGTDH